LDFSVCRAACLCAAVFYTEPVLEPESESISLAGNLLIAHPGLGDPNFHRTVLFISEADVTAGAFGLILNRPAGRSVGDLLPNKPIGALAQVPVLLGGPVQRDQLIFAAFRWHEPVGRMECRHHLMIPEAQEALEDRDTVVRAFIGYAGWSQGQLEGELAQKSWLVARPPRDLLAPEKTAHLWREVTSAFGPWFRLVAEAPEDLSRN
jgi:putative transcriptional regulator